MSSDEIVSTQPISLPTDICASIASAYSNSTLTKVVNVYQPQFIDFKASGLGDYLRGCISMLQLLKTLKRHTGKDVAFDMDVRNHPMSKFLTCDDSLERPANYATLGNFHVDSLIVQYDEKDIAYQHIVREVVRYFNRIQQPTFSLTAARRTSTPKYSTRRKP
jgi:hypothetical protein